MKKNRLRNEGTLSLRGEQWVSFTDEVLTHIEEYTVPQYGDYPNDQAQSWDASDCITAIARYASRFGTNSRPGQESLDLMKIAHYACLASAKLDVPAEATITITVKEYKELINASIEKGE